MTPRASSRAFFPPSIQSNDVVRKPRALKLVRSHLLPDSAAPAGLDPLYVGGPGYLVRVFPALMGRNARVWVHFRVSLVMDILNMAAQASIFFFVGQALGASDATWRASYAAFLAIGLVFNTFLVASLTGPYQSLAQNYWSARLETVLLSPCPVWSLLVADSIWFYVRAMMNAVILGIVGWHFGPDWKALRPI